MPQHCPQLGLNIEGKTVVDPPHFPRTVDEAMVYFSISIIDENVKQCEAAKLGNRNGLVLGLFDEELHRSGTVIKIGSYSRRYQTPAEDLVYEVAAYLPTVQRAVRKVIERILAASRFVDGETLALVPRIKSHEKAVIAAVVNRPQARAGRDREQTLNIGTGRVPGAAPGLEPAGLTLFGNHVRRLAQV